MNQKSTKEKIIDKSLEMFNDLGVENITTRHIAKELKMSQGNLHYHFPNKNKILEFLFETLLLKLKGAEEFDGKELTENNMLYSMLNNFDIMHSYRLFFQQKEVIWRRLPKVKETMILLFNRKKLEILELINIYKLEEKFREDISANQIEFLAEQFIFSIQSWLNVKNYNLENYSPKYYAKFLFRIWLPYLKNEEMKKWETLLNETH